MFVKTKTSKRRLIGYAFTILVPIVVAACGTDATLDLSAPPTKPTNHTKTSADVMSKELRNAYIASMQRNANVTYAAHASGDFVQLWNPAQRFVATLGREGLSLLPVGGAWHFSRHAQALGGKGAMAQLANGLLEARGNRITLPRNDMEEWYLHGPLGIEHGFAVPTAPECVGTKRIVMTIESDLQATLEDTDGDGRSDAVFSLDTQGIRNVG